MPQHERGLYEPGDDARVYDAAEDDEDVEGSRLPLLIVLALLVLAMFAGFVWLAYSEGVARGRGETPVITADAGPARVAPDNPGGAAEPYKGFKIYEQPAPPDDDAAAPAASSPPPATKPALTETPAPTPPAKTAAAPAAPVPATPVPAAPAKVAAATPAPKPAPALKSSQLPPQPAAPIGPATAPPRTLNAASAPIAAPPVPKPVVAAPVPAAAPALAAPVAAGAPILQIGAYKSQADADRAWTTYKAKHASLLAGYSPDVKQVDLGEKGTWFRLRIAGFPSKDVASGLCDRLKADGGSCFLGK